MLWKECLSFQVLNQSFALSLFFIFIFVEVVSSSSLCRLAWEKKVSPVNLERILRLSQGLVSSWGWILRTVCFLPTLTARPSAESPSSASLGWPQTAEVRVSSPSSAGGLVFCVGSQAPCKGLCSVHWGVYGEPATGVGWVWMGEVHQALGAPEGEFWGFLNVRCPRWLVGCTS